MCLGKDFTDKVLGINPPKTPDPVPVVVSPEAKADVSAMQSPKSTVVSEADRVRGRARLRFSQNLSPATASGLSVPGRM